MSHVSKTTDQSFETKRGWFGLVQTVLSDKASGRDNNLNLIRAVAATAVLVSHAYPIALGPDAIQPLKDLTGHSLGSLSVYVFFAISGFLITMSFERTSTYTSFMAARVLRLFPGLLISLLAVAFLLGPMVSTLGVAGYLTHIETYTFTIRNMLLYPLQYTLPGVFETQPYPSVEGSIWTLFYEVVCYMGVFVLGVIGILRRPMLVGAAFGAYLVIWFGIEWLDMPVNRIVRIQELSLPFVIGMAFYVWREKLPLSLIGVVALVGLTWAASATLAYDFVLALALSYATFWLAYIPGGLIRRYNEIGDYSYGIYIYAFPLQGLAVWLMPGQQPLTNMAISFPLTLICAVASWHLIEGPAMAMKPKLLQVLGRPARAL